MAASLQQLPCVLHVTQPLLESRPTSAVDFGVCGPSSKAHKAFFVKNYGRGDLRFSLLLESKQTGAQLEALQLSRVVDDQAQALQGGQHDFTIEENKKLIFQISVQTGLIEGAWGATVKLEAQNQWTLNADGSTRPFQHCIKVSMVGVNEPTSTILANTESRVIMHTVTSAPCRSPRQLRTCSRCVGLCMCGSMH